MYWIGAHLISLVVLIRFTLLLLLITPTLLLLFITPLRITPRLLIPLALYDLLQGSGLRSFTENSCYTDCFSLSYKKQLLY